MRAYSTDLKERLVRAVADGLPMREAARRFHVAVTTVKRAVVQERETGSLERKPIPGYPRRSGPAVDPSRRRCCERAWRLLPTPRRWNTVPGGRSTTASS
jgi:transposase